MILALAGLATGSAIPLYVWLACDAAAPPISVKALVLAVLLVVLFGKRRLQLCLIILMCFFGYARAREAVVEIMTDYASCVSISSSTEGKVTFAARVDDISGMFGESPSMVVSVLACGAGSTQRSRPQGPIAESERQLSGAPGSPIVEAPGEACMRLLIYLDNGSDALDDSISCAVLEGDIVEVQGVIAPVEGPKWFGAANQRSIYLPQGIVGTVSRGRILAVTEPPVCRRSLWSRLKRAVCSLRVGVAMTVRDHLPEAEAGMVISAFLGMKGTLPDPVDERVRRAGVSHLLSVSGMHVGMIAAGLVLLTRVLVSDQSKARVCTVPVLFLYSMLAGMRVSVLRAVLMFGLAALSRTGGLGWSSRRIAELAALVLLLINPLQLAQVSFQLSFAATYGIIVVSSFGPDLPRNEGSGSLFARIAGCAKSMAVVYLGAQIGVTPLSVLHFRSVSLVGAPATAVSAPLLTAGSVLSLIGAGLHALGLELAAVPCMCAGRWILGVLVSVAVLLGGLPFSCVDLSCAWSRALGSALVSVWSVLLSAQRGSLTRRVRLRREAVCATGIVLLIAGLAIAVTDWRASSRLELYFLSVGQGDCAVCVAPGGRTVVIDAGPRFEGSGYIYDAGESVLIPFLKWRGINHVDVLVLTHLHSDHFGGLPAMVQRRMVSVVCSSSLDGLRSLLNGESDRNPFLVELTAGDLIKIGDDVEISVFWPPEAVARDSAGDENSRSVVVEVAYHGFDALMTGDIGIAEEFQLLRSGHFALSSEEKSDVHLAQAGLDQATTTSEGFDILKVPHHGSQYSSSSAFLRSVSPWMSVVSVGSNGYGHPARATLTRLARYSQAVVRTDQDGSVKVLTDGRQFTAVTSRGRVLADGIRLQ